MEIKFYSGIDKGRVKKLNEDSIKILEDISLFVIADGMGGHSAGEIASKLAVDNISDFILKAKLYNPDDTKIGVSKDVAPSDLFNPTREIEESIKYANTVINDYSKRQEKLRGMGTTVVAGLFYKNNLYVGSVGDSRVYVIRNNKIYKITEDDVVDEKDISRKNVITNALGRRSDVETHIYSLLLAPQDIIIGCSDGLYKVLSDEEILEIVSDYNLNYDSLSSFLINIVNKKGGPDNISIVIAKVEKLDDDNIFANKTIEPVIKKEKKEVPKISKKEKFASSKTLLYTIFSIFALVLILYFLLNPKYIYFKLNLNFQPKETIDEINEIKGKIEIDDKIHNILLGKNEKGVWIAKNKENLKKFYLENEKEIISLNFLAKRRKPVKIYIENDGVIKPASFYNIMPDKKNYETNLQIYSQSFFDEKIKMENYNNALNLMSERKFKEAKEIFYNIIDFKDSKEKYDLCKKIEDMLVKKSKIETMQNPKEKAKIINEFNSTVQKYNLENYVGFIKKEEIGEEKIEEVERLAKKNIELDRKEQKQIQNQLQKKEEDPNKEFEKNFYEALNKLEENNPLCYNILSKLQNQYEKNKEMFKIRGISKFYFNLAKASILKYKEKNDSYYCLDAKSFLIKAKTENEISEAEFNNFKERLKNENCN